MTYGRVVRRRTGRRVHAAHDRRHQTTPPVVISATRSFQYQRSSQELGNHLASGLGGPGRECRSSNTMANVRAVCASRAFQDTRGRDARRGGEGVVSEGSSTAWNCRMSRGRPSSVTRNCVRSSPGTAAMAVRDDDVHGDEPDSRLELAVWWLAGDARDRPEHDHTDRDDASLTMNRRGPAFVPQTLSRYALRAADRRPAVHC